MEKTKGFTLIELLIVIGIIAILAAIIYVAVDPARRLQDARDAERWSSVNSILNAVLKYTVDGSGTMPPSLTGIDTGTYMIGTAGSGCDTCTATTTDTVCVDLAADVVPTYLSSMPLGPNGGTASITGYYIYRASSGRITAGSCSPDRATAVSVSR